MPVFTCVRTLSISPGARRRRRARSHGESGCDLIAHGSDRFRDPRHTRTTAQLLILRILDTPPVILPSKETVLQSDAQALCPHCRAILPARVVARDGRVLLDRSCPRHGPQVTLLSSDADWYVRALRFDLPATPPATPALTTTHGCPDDCGLCPEHAQHTCLAVMEVTQACNLAARRASPAPERWRLRPCASTRWTSCSTACWRRSRAFRCFR